MEAAVADAGACAGAGVASAAPVAVVAEAAAAVVSILLSPSFFTNFESPELTIKFTFQR